MPLDLDLPTPGGDPGNWGTRLNNALEGTGPGTLDAALSATYAAKSLETDAVQKWKPNTAYAAGDRVINPSGEAVLARAAFTSGATYDASKWRRPAAAASLREFTGRNLNLASRVATPFDVLFLGDSLFQGQAQSGVSARWPNRTIQRLRSRLPVPGVAGGVGYWPTVWSHATPANPWTFTGNQATSNTRGLGRLGKTIGATTGSGPGSGTMTFTGTGITLVWYAPGAETASIVIDGGAPATFTGGGTPSHGLKLWSSPALTAGQHTITVTHASGNILVLQGAIVYDGDESKGIRCWEGAQSGSSAMSFNGVETTNGQLWAENIGFTVVPDLVVINWMTNDATTRTAAQYQTSLGHVRDLVRTKTSAPILWAAPWQRAATLIEPWANYVAAMRAVADADSGESDFVNIGELVPMLNPDPFGALADGTHPTDKFAAYLGEVLAEHILTEWATAA